MLPLRWLGKRRFDGRQASAATPVCIRRGALGDELPASDLWLGPDHLVVWGGHAVAAGRLVNGGSVVTAEIGKPSPTLFHVELDAGVAVFAEGLMVRAALLPEERGWFANGATAPQVTGRSAEPEAPDHMVESLRGA